MGGRQKTHFKKNDPVARANRLQRIGGALVGKCRVFDDRPIEEKIPNGAELRRIDRYKSGKKRRQVLRESVLQVGFLEADIPGLMALANQQCAQVKRHLGLRRHLTLFQILPEREIGSRMIGRQIRSPWSAKSQDIPRVT
ncbi:hypothetical protein [Ferirhizobium litorale]|uniref:Uncharacterized protein n=1 Tax=Ferirhizobium litorale TaxID=2927786 RepID=A0AAE3QG89_9HYPH|nr:hypothetical protein [Fererhizobium litorale]MDI7922624.1 hypothetical protein [Fererhizobium litorale]